MALVSTLAAPVGWCPGLADHFIGEHAVSIHPGQVVGILAGICSHPLTFPGHSRGHLTRWNQKPRFRAGMAPEGACLACYSAQRADDA